jgi:hypothetical protein
MVEKFFSKVPRVARKIERFYVNIVEESLFGKDPDVAEDVCDDKVLWWKCILFKLILLIIPRVLNTVPVHNCSLF